MSAIAFPNLDKIEDQAADWVAEIDRGLSAKEQTALERWLAESEFHGEALVKCASMWDLLDVLKPISTLVPVNSELEGNQVQELTRRNFEKTRGSLIAASFLLLMGALIYTNLPFTGQVPIVKLVQDKPEKTLFKAQFYESTVGETSIVTLTDGSSLELNTDSEVVVRFTDSKRNIELLRGEVYFDVAKDASKPFEVKVGQDKVTAIGTAFSIDAGEPLDDRRSLLEVVVTHGKVKVTSRKTQLPIYLEPGQKAVARDDSFEVSYDADPDATLAWRNGMLVFQGESLTEVIRELNRYTPLKFRLIDQELMSIPVGGLFKTGNLDQLLAVLENNFSVSSEIVGNEILLTKSN